MALTQPAPDGPAPAWSTSETSPWADFWNLRRTQPRRSFVFYGIGALAGLAIAGYGLFTAQGTATHHVPPEDVALVNQRPILRTDFIAQTETESGKSFSDATVADRMKVLDEMVREELLVQRGLELDFPGTDPDTRNALVSAVEQQAVADVTTNLPNEAELRRYFEQHRGRYAAEGMMTLRHFRLSTASPSDPDALARATQAAAALREGTPAADVVRRYGLDEIVPEHSGAEEFYFAEKIHLGDLLFSQALALDDGTVSAPIAAEGGLHILQMLHKTPPQPLAFERIRSQVLSDFVAEAKQRLVTADEAYLRSRADIRISDDLAATYAASQHGANTPAAAAVAASTRPPPISATTRSQ